MSKVVEIVLDSPGKNALGTALMTELAERLDAAGDAPVLLTGSNGAFSAGLDLKEVASLDADGMLSFLRRLGRLTDRLFHHPGPTVAVVNGHAIAGGCILAVACDHRIGTTNPKAMIGLNEVALGLRFPPSLLEILKYRVSRLEAVILGSALHPPARALELGLLDELADDPLAVGRERLAALASSPADAYAAAKKDLRRGIGGDADAERLFLEEVLPVWTSDALKTRIAGFLGKRTTA
jgi:enoyl-CoA hydratase